MGLLSPNEITVTIMERIAGNLFFATVTRCYLSYYRIILCPPRVYLIWLFCSVRVALIAKVSFRPTRFVRQADTIEAVRRTSPLIRNPSCNCRILIVTSATEKAIQLPFSSGNFVRSTKSTVTDVCLVKLAANSESNQIKTGLKALPRKRII